MNRDQAARFLVVAPSARAISNSISLAGYSCNAFDLFADRDTRQICSVRRVRSMNRAASMAAMAAPGTSIVLGGGLENRINRFGALATGVSICGSPLSGIRGVRDPFLLRDALRNGRLPYLEVTSRRPRSGSWIAKPRNSTGGQGVCQIDDLQDSLTEEYYFQSFVAGPVFGAVFVACGGQCNFIGVTRQIIEPHGDDSYSYHGSVGPVDLPGKTIHRLTSMAVEIAGTFDLAGWFGIDFALDDGEPMVLEVNPRYTASMELFERLSGRSLFEQHLDAVAGRLASTGNDFQFDENRNSGKRYVFNRTGKPLIIGSRQQAVLDDIASRQDVMVSDIPCRGTSVNRHGPICTVYVSGRDTGSITTLMNELDHEIMNGCLC